MLKGENGTEWGLESFMYTVSACKKIRLAKRKKRKQGHPPTQGQLCRLWCRLKMLKSHVMHEILCRTPTCIRACTEKKKHVKQWRQKIHVVQMSQKLMLWYLQSPSSLSPRTSWAANHPLFVMVYFLTGECIFPSMGCPCFYCKYVSLLSFLILEFKNLEGFQKLTLYHHISQYEH